MAENNSNYRNTSKELMAFIKKSPTAFHVVNNFSKMLESAGFVKLNEMDRWEIKPNGKYYVTRNDSSIIAFCMPENEDFYNFQIAAAHSDSPAFKIKENPEMIEDSNYVTLNVEKYGGMLMAPWLDRPLSVAGRVIIKDDAQALTKSSLSFPVHIEILESTSERNDESAPCFVVLPTSSLSNTAHTFTLSLFVSLLLINAFMQL